MKIDFSAVLLNVTNNKPIKDAETDKDLTLGAASVTALLAMSQQSQNDTGEVKFRCYQLAQKLQPGGEVEIEPGDAEFIKTRISYIYGPVVLGPAFALLNG